MKKYFIAILFFAAASFSQDQVIRKGDVLYLANKLIVKYKQTTDVSYFKNSSVPTNSIKQLKNIGSIEVKNAAPTLKEEAKNYSDIERTYVVEYASPYDPQALANKISKSSDVEWAEPWYVYEVSFEPNDPKYLDGTQWYLNIISASQAWDLSTGSEDIVIAINDTGVDWDHPDLAANIWNNSDEIPDNGIDDDGNGYIDDIRGWDFGGTSGTGDNNPMEDAPTHGTYVSGFASAVANNGEGIASIGYRCKIMPTKTSQQDIGNGIISYGREGIIYAANNGAKVINCSWGGSPYSQALQDAITYATSLGTLVVSSADNDNKIEPAYPSAYDGVLSVGGSDSDDKRYSASNYGATVDVVAPATGAANGLGMYSTWQDNTYTSNASGTSLASPIVAGLAGLVFQKFPTYTPLQVAEQIRVNTDYIDDKNPGYEYYLGTGRVNAFKTLNNTNSISIRAEKFVYTDLSNGNGVTEPGESFSLGLRFKNYLTTATNTQVTLESRSEYVAITHGSYVIPGLDMLGETNNFTAPFTFTIAENIPVNQDVELLIKYTYGNSYNDFQLIRTKFNTTYLTQAGNDMALTITSQGRLGYNDYGQQPSEGDGLSFEQGGNVLFESALIYGSSENMVMDAAHINYLQSSSEDFQSVIPFNISVPGEHADYEGFTEFNDNGANPSLGIETELFTYSFSQDEYSKFIILRYRFTNNSDTTINTFHAGLFFDLDLNDFDDDHTLWDFTDHFGYAYDEDPSDGARIDDYIGVALISDTHYGYRALSNEGSLGGVNIIDGYTKDEKWLTIASATTITEFGPGDIAFAVSGGPYTLQAGERLNVAFAVAGGKSFEELRTAIANSRTAYGLIPTSVEKVDEEIPQEFSLSQNYPNPFNPSTTISFTVPPVGRSGASLYNTKLIVYDVLGREIKTLLNKPIQPGNYEVDFDASGLTSGVYFYVLETGGRRLGMKMLLVK